MREKISIIVPIYNVENYLDDCIESIANQTYPNLEIILVNDGSTDNSDAICKKWEQKDNRIVYINQKNSGVSVSRNNGLKKASGVYVSFVDGDDSLEPSMIEDLYKMIIKQKTNVVVCDYYTMNKNQKKEENYFSKSQKINIQQNKQEILEKILQLLGVPWGKLYSREFLKKNNLQFKVGLKRMQDTIFTLDAFELCDDLYYLHKPLYNYRIFQNSACNKYSPDFDNTAKEILGYLQTYLMNNQLWDTYQYLYYTKMQLLILEMIKLKYIPDQCKMQITKKIQMMKNDINSFHLDYKMVSSHLLDKKAKIGSFLLKHKLYYLFYMIYKINYKLKKLRNFE